MDSHYRRAAWWQLYLLGLAMIGLLVIEARAALSALGHQALAIGTLLVAYGLMDRWVRANKLALLQGTGAQESRARVSRGSLAGYAPWTLPAESGLAEDGSGNPDPGEAVGAAWTAVAIASGGNGDREWGQAAAPVAAPAERSEG